MFRIAAGIELQNVAHPGSAPNLPASMAGDVQMIFDVVLTALPLRREGRLRAPGVTTRERLAVLPDLPAIAEFCPGYEATTWFGVAAPRGMPAPVEARLRAALARAQADAGFVARFAPLGLMMQPPHEAAAMDAALTADTAGWGAVIRCRGIVLEWEILITLHLPAIFEQSATRRPHWEQTSWPGRPRRSPKSRWRSKSIATSALKSAEAPARAASRASS